MSDDEVLYEVADHVATITLNAPQRMNTISAVMLRDLSQRLLDADRDRDVRCIILTGAGRAFCAGLDLKELGAGGADIGRATVTSRGDPVDSLTRCAKPVIGAINGAAVTGGFELALACDVLLASSEARFADTHARVGLASGWGLSQRLSRAVGIYRAREISLGSRWVSAEQAAAWGFVNRVVPPHELMPAARALAADMLLAQPGMLERYKAIINDGFARTFADGMALEAQRAREFNARVSADEIEQRREAVRERNRRG